MAHSIPCFQTSGDGLIFLDVGNRRARYNRDGIRLMEERLKHGAELLVFFISVGVLPAPEVVDLAGYMLLIRRDALFAKKLDWLRVSLKKSLIGKQGKAVADGLTFLGKRRRKAFQKGVQDAKMEEAGGIGLFSLLDLPLIPGG